MPDPDEVISKASSEKDAIQDNIREVANWFHNQEGELIEKAEAISRIDDELDVEATHDDIASDIVSSLAGDHVDPVQHVSNSDGQFVGVIEYKEYEGYYSFTEYHDIGGKHTRAVCGACIKSSTRSSEPFTRHTGDFGNEPHGNEERLHELLSDHIEEEHNVVGDVETGATLASGTTIAGNASLHAGNLNTSYTFTAEQTFSGGVDLSGGAVDDTSQGYLDITGDGNDLRLATGQSIEDGGGNNRVSLTSNSVDISDSAGTKRGEFDDSGNLSIEGSLTEGAAL